MQRQPGYILLNKEPKFHLFSTWLRFSYMFTFKEWLLKNEIDSQKGGPVGDLLNTFKNGMLLLYLTEII